MDLEIRPHSPEELWDYRTAVARGFGYDPIEKPGERELYLQRHEPDRSLVAVDDGHIIGTSVAYTFQISVPGGALVPTAGLTDVTVATTHRRRGILTRLMQRHLENARDRGEQLAALWASESGIYTRFGFGMAMHHERWEMSTSYADFAYQPEVPGKVRFATATEMRALAPEIYQRVVRIRPGMICRPDGWWNFRFYDPEHRRQGMSSFYFAVYEEDGRPLGYAQYRIQNNWEQKKPDKMLVLEELVAESDAAHAALWRFCLDVDMVTHVKTEHQPTDDALWWMLADPRRLSRASFDSLWLRVIDPVKALSARTYQVEHRTVLGIRDEFCPWVAGNYEVDGGPDGATVKPTKAEADLFMWGAGLAACYMGGAPFSRLARAGRIGAKSEKLLRQADLMFSSPRAPYCPFLF